ncbi:MAG: hypothetical protein J5999_05195 [Oscillospiraceae bacterium]|nr:hypothetical protein [Oscillospiraceae bacterium]
MIWVILIIAWLVSPLVLLPLFIGAKNDLKSKEKELRQYMQILEDMKNSGKITPQEHFNLVSAAKSGTYFRDNTNGYNMPTYTVPVPPAQNLQSETQASEPAPAAESNRPIPENSGYVMPSYQQRSVPQYAEKKPSGGVSSMNIVLLIGVIMVFMAGIIFATSALLFFDGIGKLSGTVLMTILLFLLSGFFMRKEMEKTALAMYRLGSVFLPVNVICAGYFALFGELFSFGDTIGTLTVIGTAAAVFAIPCIIGAKLYEHKSFAVLTWVSGLLTYCCLTGAAVNDKDIFAVLAAAAAVVVTAASHFAKRLPEKEKKGVFSKVFGICSASSVTVLSAAAIIASGTNIIGAVICGVLAAAVLSGVLDEQLEGSGAVAFAVLVTACSFKAASPGELGEFIFICGALAVSCGIVGYSLPSLTEKAAKLLRHISLFSFIPALLIGGGELFYEEITLGTLIVTAMLSAECLWLALCKNDKFSVHTIPIAAILLSAQLSIYLENKLNTEHIGFVIFPVLAAIFGLCFLFTPKLKRIGETPAFPAALLLSMGICSIIACTEGGLEAVTPVLLSCIMTAVMAFSGSGLNRRIARISLPIFGYIASYLVTLFGGIDFAIVTVAYVCIYAAIDLILLLLSDKWDNLKELETILGMMLIPFAFIALFCDAEDFYCTNVLLAASVSLVLRSLMMNKFGRKYACAAMITGNAAFTAFLFALFSFRLDLGDKGLIVPAAYAAAISGITAVFTKMGKRGFCLNELLIFFSGWSAVLNLFLLFQSAASEELIWFAVCFNIINLTVFCTNNSNMMLMGLAAAFQFYLTPVFICSIANIDGWAATGIAAAAAALGVISGIILFGNNILTQTDTNGKTVYRADIFTLTVPTVLLCFGEPHRIFCSLIFLAASSMLYFRRTGKIFGDRAALTFALSFGWIAWYFIPNLEIPEMFLTEFRLLPVPIVCFLLTKIHKGYEVQTANISFVAAILSMGILAFEAASEAELFAALTAGIVSLSILIISFVIKKKRWFVLAAAVLGFLTVYLSFSLRSSMGWLAFLLIGGGLLIVIGAVNESKRKNAANNGSENKTRFMSDWEW